MSSVTNHSRILCVTCTAALQLSKLAKCVVYIQHIINSVMLIWLSCRSLRWSLTVTEMTWNGSWCSCQMTWQLTDLKPSQTSKVFDKMCFADFSTLNNMLPIVYGWKRFALNFSNWHKPGTVVAVYWHARWWKFSVYITVLVRLPVNDKCWFIIFMVSYSSVYCRIIG